jgi:hypothetical protein
MIGHRLVGIALMCKGDMPGSRAHCDQSLALYDPAEHRPLATRFGQDNRVASLSYRSVASWLCGYPNAALVDIKQALKDAREIDNNVQGPTSLGGSSPSSARAMNSRFLS